MGTLVSSANFVKIIIELPVVSGRSLTYMVYGPRDALIIVEFMRDLFHSYFERHKVWSAFQIIRSHGLYYISFVVHSLICAHYYEPAH